MFPGGSFGIYYFHPCDSPLTSYPTHLSFQSLLNAHRLQEVFLTLLTSREPYFLLRFHVHLGDRLVRV